jgi:outer membrane protein assembly factor BamB
VTGSIYYTPVVDYATRRVYFTTYDDSLTNPNLHCLQISDVGAPFGGPNPVWQITVPTAADATNRAQLSTGPILRNGRIYVGDTKGAIYSLRASDGRDIRRFDTGTGQAVLGFLFPDRASDALYFTTGDTVYKVVDSDTDGLTLSGGWSVAIPPTATMPLFYRGFAWTASGGSGATDLPGRDGTIDPPDPGDKDLVVTDTPGQPTLDTGYGVMYLGTSAGSLYAVPVDMP